MTNIKSEFSKLRSQNCSFHEDYKDKKKQHDKLLTNISQKIDNDWGDYRVNIEDLKYNTDHFHNMIEQQIKITEGTFSLMERAIDKLDDTEVRLNHTISELNITKEELNDTRNELDNTKNELKDTKARVELLSTYRDWIKKFINKLVIKLGGEEEWRKVKDAISDYYDYDIDVSQHDCIIHLKKILENVNMTIGDFELLLEMKDISNEKFHKNGQNMRQAKERLNEPFPDDLNKFKDPLWKAFGALEAWRPAR